LPVELVAAAVDADQQFVGAVEHNLLNSGPGVLRFADWALLRLCGADPSSEFARAIAETESEKLRNEQQLSADVNAHGDSRCSG
jgi:hypothetical protein